MDDERKLVFDAVTDAFNDFVFLNRKLDKALPWARLAQLVRDGVATKEEIVGHFKELIDSWDVSSGIQP